MIRFTKAALAVTIMVLYVASMAGAAEVWTETWESYTSGSTPYGPWVLGNGTWMALGTPNHTPGGSKSYKIAPAATSRIGRNFGFSGGLKATDMASITLEGWFYDTTTATTKRSFLGFQNEFTVDDALLRIGFNNAAQYQVHYYAAGALQTINVGFGNEVGWHYTKLALTNLGGGNWRIDWQVNKVDGTPYTGNFTYAWKASTATKVVLGFNYSSTYEVDWDDIKLSAVVIPEPSSLIALGTGLVGVVGLMRRRRT